MEELKMPKFLRIEKLEIRGMERLTFLKTSNIFAQKNTNSLGNEKSAQNWSQTPSGHGCPRLRVKDVRAKKLYFPALRAMGEKHFGPGRPPEYPPDVLGISCAKPFSDSRNSLQVLYTVVADMITELICFKAEVCICNEN